MKRRFLCYLLSIMMVLASFSAGYPREALAGEIPAGVSMVYPDIAYDQGNNNYLAVYTKMIEGTGYLTGQFLNAQGVKDGGEQTISTLNSSNVHPSVVDAAYAGAPAYFIVWLDDKIYGQFIDADNGALLGERIQISDEDAMPNGGLAVAYDSVNQRCLVVWEDYRYPADDSEYRSRDIYGQLVTGDAGLQGVNFVICNNGADGSTADQYEPAAAFDSVNGRYLVVWQDFRSFDTNDIYGQFVSVNGEMMGNNSKTNFLISDAPGNQDQATVAFDSINQNFLVVFRDFRNGGSNVDIYGQIVSGEEIMGGLLYTPSASNMAISGNDSQQQDPVVSFNPDTGHYLVTWEDERNSPGSIDIYGQMINSGGSLYPVSGDSKNNFIVLSREGFSRTPALAFNSQEKSYLMADSYDSGDGLCLIDYALIPPEVDFQAKVDYSVGGQPYGIAAGDFNSDGHADLAVTNGNESSYSILTGTAGGSFSVQTSAQEIYSPQWVAAGDFDGDDHSDLAITANSWGGLAVLKGNGSGAFSPPTGYETGTSANTVITADFDGDGDLDLAVSNYHGDSVSIYLNDNGSFGVDRDADGTTNESNLDYVVEAGPCRMAAADFNQDGHTDLVVGCDYAETLNILLNDGSGSFYNAPSLPSGPNPIGIAAEDFDQDGMIDLAVANNDTSFDNTGNVTLFRGSGDGNFSEAGNLSVNDGPVGIVTADFNTDGFADLAAANRYQNSVTLLLGNARGGFVRQDFPVGDRPMNLVSEDFDDDGKPDLAVVNYGSNSVSVLLSGAAVPPASYTVSIGSLTGGSITANPTTATTGTAINLTITPDEGMRLKAGSLKYNDGTEDHLINDKSFSMPAANVMVSAEFEAIPSNHDGSSNSGGGSHTPTSSAVKGRVIDRATGNVISGLTADITMDSHGNVTVSMNAAQIALLKKTDGSAVPVSDRSKVAISDATGTSVRISSNGTIQIANLARGTAKSFNITYDLGNGQKIIIGTMEIKVDSDGDVTIVTELIDPYGIITDAATGKVLDGVNVTLYYANTDRNKAAGKTPDTVVALPGIKGFEPNDNENPQNSDVNGAYGFMVFPETDYYIVATKDGYNPYTSVTIPVEQEIVRWDFRMNQTSSGVTRLAGLDRVDTALAIAKANYSGKLDKVILATADNYPDALAGSVLAYKLNAPILLVGSSAADQEKVLAYMTANMNSSGTVYILGGTAVVSSAMESKVAAKWPKVIRIAGTDRYETSAKITEQLEIKPGTPVVLVSGENYPDALSISSVAAQMQNPILLVQKDEISDTVRQKIAAIKPVKLYIIGLQGVISTDVENQAAQITGLAKTNIIRIGGFDRFETSLAVAQYFNLSGYACIATGNNYPDALAGSVYAANHNSPIILADIRLSDQVMNYLKTRKLTGGTIFGGESVLGKDIEQQLERCMGQ